MTKDRVVALSDGIIAVIITIMVLEMRVPHGTDWSALRSVLPGTTIITCCTPRSASTAV